MYNCYYDDGSYQVMFSKDGEAFNSYSDLSGIEFKSSDFTKIEPLEQPDTLQEVVEWCRENEKEFCVSMQGELYIASVFQSVDDVLFTNEYCLEL